MSRLGIARWVLAFAILAGDSGGQEPEPTPRPSGESPVRAVLGEEDYPWYDRDRDEVRPLLPDPSSWSERLRTQVDAVLDWVDRHLRGTTSPGTNPGRTAGSIVPALLFLASGSVFLVLLWRLWQLHDPRAAPEAQPPLPVGEAARMAGLAGGSSLRGVDPWAEALRRRAAGDLAGAVVWLFVDQLLALNRAGIIHLTPGNTARQYVHSLRDPPLREGLGAALAAFEDVYYGGRSPDPATVEALWARAEAVHGRLETLGRAT